MADPFDNAIEFCGKLVTETSDFDVELFQRMRAKYRFNMDRLPSTKPPERLRMAHELENVGGYPAHVLQLVRAVGRVTLNSACYFAPNTHLDELRTFADLLRQNLGISPEDLRFLGGDHGEGHWAVLTASGQVFFMELDADYGGSVPGPCFASVANWHRVNFIIGLMESELEARGVDVYADVPAGFAEKLLGTLSPIDARLKRETWPFRLLYGLA